VGETGGQMVGNFDRNITMTVKVLSKPGANRVTLGKFKGGQMKNLCRGNNTWIGKKKVAKGG